MRAVLVVKGGPGSGNHGHAGRPGQVGGSAPGVRSQLPTDFVNGSTLEWQARNYYMGVKHRIEGNAYGYGKYEIYDARNYPAMASAAINRLEGEIEMARDSKDYPDLTFWVPGEKGEDIRLNISVGQANIIMEDLKAIEREHIAYMNDMHARIGLNPMDYLNTLGIDVNTESYYDVRKLDKDRLNVLLDIQDKYALGMANVVSDFDVSMFTKGEVMGVIERMNEQIDANPDLNQEQKDNAKSWIYGLDHELRQEMEFRVRHEVALGNMDPEYAAALDWYEASHTQGRDGSWELLPDKVWHVTTNSEAVMADRLRSRRELHMRSGTGLGGGEDDTISVTDDYQAAVNIERSIHEAHMVASGSMMPSRMVELARSGAGTKSRKPWISMLSSWVGGESAGSGETDDDLPYQLKHLLRLENGGWKTEKNYDGTQMTWEDFLEDVWDFYNYKFLGARQEAGGFENPVFFGTDWKALAKLNPANFAIIQLRPIRGARGYRMAGLGEWRTVGGDTMDVEELINAFYEDDLTNILGE